MMMVSMNDFHLRLQRLRDERGLTQDEMSAQGRVSLRYYQDLEQGRKLPSMEKLGEMLIGFGITAGQFFRDPPEKHDVINFGQTISFLSTFEGLSPLRKRLVLGLVYDDPSFVSEEPRLSQGLEALLKVR